MTGHRPCLDCGAAIETINGIGQPHDCKRQDDRATAIARAYWAGHDRAKLNPEGRVERYCELMHDAYERAAVGAGWETNPASRKPWADVPESNKVTMRAAVSALLAAVDAERSGAVA